MSWGLFTDIFLIIGVHYVLMCMVYELDKSTVCRKGQYSKLLSY